ncbi:MAG: hypothetical protein CMO01_04640 [Thalassobius sp.]|nr:hypothetical protein [Thalassovita sp.]
MTIQTVSQIKSGKDIYTFLKQEFISEFQILSIIEDIRSGEDTHVELDQYYLIKLEEVHRKTSEVLFKLNDTNQANYHYQKSKEILKIIR